MFNNYKELKFELGETWILSDKLLKDDTLISTDINTIVKFKIAANNKLVTVFSTLDINPVTLTINTAISTYQLTVPPSLQISKSLQFGDYIYEIEVILSSGLVYIIQQGTLHITNSISSLFPSS